MQVTWVEGDATSEPVKELLARVRKFQSLNVTQEKNWANGTELCRVHEAYLGGLGIAEALEMGADIVICD